MAFLQNAKNRIVGRGAGIVCMIASNDNTKMFIVDEEDFDRVKNHTWSVDRYYMTAKINKKNVSLHRFVKNAADESFIDHINRNKLDNRKSNLRECNNAQNCQNRGKQRNNTSGLKGVSFHRRDRKWQAKIRYTNNEVRNCLRKFFNTREEAARQYDIWAREHHREFAYLNNV